MLILLLLMVALLVLLPILLHNPAAGLTLSLMLTGLAAPALLAGNSSHAVARLKLCWLRVDASASTSYDATRGVYVVSLSLALQPPDPCHRILSVNAMARDGTVYVYLRGESPEPGTMCIQVLPKPTMFKSRLQLPKNPEKLVLVFQDARNGETCRATLPLRG